MCCALLLLGVLFPSGRLDGAALAEQATVWVDDGFHAGTPGWNVTHFASLTQGLSAVAAGGTIHLNEGVYIGPFQIAKAGVLIAGAGFAANTVLHGNGANYGVYITANNVSLTRVKVTGASVQGVRLASCAGGRIADCIIQGNGCAGVEISAGQNHVIENNQIADNQSAGQALGVRITQGASGVIVRQNHIQRHRDTLQQGAGILVEAGCSATQVLTNTVEDNNFGVRVVESSGSNIQGNTVSQSGSTGIHIQDALASTLRGNQSSHNLGGGIMLVHQASPESLTAELALVESNVCEDNGAAGIYARGAGHLRLQYNTCRANALHGLAVESSYLTITANSLVSNTLVGLRLYDLDPYTGRPITGVVAHGNTLVGNGTHGLHSEMPSQVEATGNWWGLNAPSLDNEVVGNVAYQPYMTLAVQAVPGAIAIGGEATQISVHVGGGGAKVINDTLVRLEVSAGAMEPSTPLLTASGQASAQLHSAASAQHAVVTVTVDSAVVTTTVEFYDPAHQGADLTLTLDGSPDPVCAGYNLVYSLACQNTGSVALHQVRLTDTLPEGSWPLLDQSSPGAVYDAGSRTVRWELGTLAIGARTALELRLHTATSLSAGQSLANIVVVTANELVAVRAEESIAVIACATPTPSATATAAPTYTPAPTATATPSPTPTDIPLTTGAVGGRVWVDANRNGQYDASELAWAGAVVELHKGQSPTGAAPLSATQTGLDGRYAFVALAEGEYCLRLSPQPGYWTAPNEQCVAVAASSPNTVDWTLIQGSVIALPYLQK